MNIDLQITVVSPLLLMSLQKSTCSVLAADDDIPASDSQCSCVSLLIELYKPGVSSCYCLSWGDD